MLRKKSKVNYVRFGDLPRRRQRKSRKRKLLGLGLGTALVVSGVVGAMKKPDAG
jgi:hypothetical protein